MGSVGEKDFKKLFLTNRWFPVYDIAEVAFEVILTFRVEHPFKKYQSDVIFCWKSDDKKRVQ